MLIIPRLVRASRLIGSHTNVVLFITSSLGVREIKMASALRGIGWKVILICIRTNSFKPEKYFDETIRVKTEAQAHAYATALGPRICQVFSDSVDGMLYRFCADKPSPVVVDMKDIVCPSLFEFGQARYEPTRECLGKADGLCAQDLQAKSAQKLDGFPLPRHLLLFPDCSWQNGRNKVPAESKAAAEEVRVACIGSFGLEATPTSNVAHLKFASMLAEQRIQLHIYPPPSVSESVDSPSIENAKRHFADFCRLLPDTAYIHLHERPAPEEFARVLSQYDFGIVAGGSPAFGAAGNAEYLKACYSPSISDFLDAGLAVLANRELRFDYWFLKRHGSLIDLDGLQRPGFREQLLAIKRKNNYSAQQESGVRNKSIDGQRLARFYNRIMDETASHALRLGYPLTLLRYAPFLGRSFRHLEVAVRQGNRTIMDLQKKLEIAEHRNAPISPVSGVANQAPGLLQVEQARVSFPSSHQEYRRRSIANAKLRLEVERGAHWADELSGLLNWPDIKDPAEQTTGMPEMLEMIGLFAAGSASLNQLSSCWQVLGFKNFNQLLRDGYRNFKRTIGCSYFNFLVQRDDPQIAFLESELGEEERRKCWQAAESLPDDPNFDWHDQKSYRYFVLMLWSFARRVDTAGRLDLLEEPDEGNPLVVPSAGRKVSQDLANSLLEYYSVAEGVDFDKCNKVLEIGGGYGRDAYVILELNPQIQYTLVDIPPALWVAQRYLSSVFGKRTVFRVRDFHSYDEVKDEMEQASIVFLLPHQLDLLPDRRFDLSLNISSFGEMQPEQIRTYLDILERLTKGHFYMKQWKVSQNAFDHLALTEDNYPVSRTWSKVYSRTCRVQTSFFEALYLTSGPKR